jgi:hypothetical protein
MPFCRHESTDHRLVDATCLLVYSCAKLTLKRGHRERGASGMGGPRSMSEQTLPSHLPKTCNLFWSSR